MQVQNNKEEVPFAHYEEKFRALDPVESAKRCGVPFADGKFSVRRVFLCRFCKALSSGKVPYFTPFSIKKPYDASKMQVRKTQKNKPLNG